MADGTTAGSIKLGIELDQQDLINKFNQLAIAGAKAISDTMSSRANAPVINADFSKLTKDLTAAMDRGVSTLENRLKQGIGSLDFLSDKVQAAIENGAKQGAAGLSKATEKAANNVKMPQLKVEFTSQDWANQLETTVQKLDLVNAKLFEGQKNIDAMSERMSQYNKMKEMSGADFPAATKLAEDLSKASMAQVKLTEQSNQYAATARSLESTIVKAKSAEAAAADAARMKTQQAAAAQASAAVQTQAASVRQTTAAVKAGSTINSSMRKAAAGVQKVTKATRASQSGFKKLGKAALMLFGIRSVYGLARKAVMSLNQSLLAAANQNKAFGATMNGLKQSASTLKASFGAMVAPLVAAVAPALDFIIRKVTAAFNAIAMFFAKLSGQSTVLQAVGSTEQFTSAYNDNAGAADKAAKAADAYKRQLAGFDELEILTFDKGSGADAGAGGAGGGGGAGSPGPIFQEVNVHAMKFEGFLSEIFEKLSNTEAFQKLQEAARTAWDFISQRGSGAAEKIQESWAKNAPRIAASWASIGGMLLEANVNMASYVWIPLIAGAAGAGIEIGGSIVAGLIEVFASASALVEAIFRPFYDAINDFFDMHGPEISNKMYETWAIIGEGLSEVIDGVVLAITMPFDGLAAWFTENGLSIKESFVSTWEMIWEATAPIWDRFNSTARQIFGGLRDFLLEVAPNMRNTLVNAFDMAWKVIKPIWDALVATAKVVFGGLAVYWGQWGEKVKAAFSVAWTLITGIFNTKLQFFSDLFAAFSNLFSGNWQGFWDGIKTTFSNVWRNIQQIFIRVVGIIKNVLDALGVDLNGIGEGIKTTFAGVVQFISGAFSRDWRRAWQGVKNIFKGIVDTFVIIIKTPINGIIDVMNGMLRKLNGLSIPLPQMLGGGQIGFNIPLIPRLAKGGVVDQPTLAMVGEAGKEAVMPLENNTGWISKLAGMIAEQGGAGGGDVHVTIPVHIGEGNLMDVIEAHFDRQGRIRNASTL